MAIFTVFETIAAYPSVTAMELDDPVIRKPGFLVKAVNVLRDDAFQHAHLIEPGDCRVRRIGPGFEQILVKLGFLSPVLDSSLS